MRGRAQQFGGLPYLLRREVWPNLQGAGVQREQRDPMGEHVVHLARDEGALGHPGTVGLQTLLGLGAQGTLAQRVKSCRRARTNIPQAVTASTSGTTLRNRDSASSRRAVDREGKRIGIHSAATSRAGRRRDARRGRTGRSARRRWRTPRTSPAPDRQRDAKGPAPPPPERQTGQRPAGYVEDDLRGRQCSNAAAQGRAQEKRPNAAARKQPKASTALGGRDISTA